MSLKTLREMASVNRKHPSLLKSLGPSPHNKCAWLFIKYFW